MPADAPKDVQGGAGIHVGDAAGNVTFSALGDIVGGNKIVTINTTIQISTAAISQRPLLTASPYRGLDRFDDRDRDLFFGRDQLIKGLLAQLGGSNLLLVLGASGSGKSSVVRAGLLPSLSALLGARFRYFTLVPDLNPFESLRGALHGAGFTQTQTRSLGEEGASPLPELFRRLQRPGDEWLIFVDQFEEIFTTTDERHRLRFIASLLDVARDPAASTKLVLAMRAEFVDRFGPFPELAERIQRCIALVADMHADELRLAIEQPAARHGVVFEAGLVEEIIGDVQGQAGSLPLLQYTLNLLWEEERRRDGLAGRCLRAKTYRELGGARGAIEKRSEDIYAALGQDGDPDRARVRQDIVRKIFLRLVDISGVGSDDAAWRPVRRRIARAQIGAAQEQEVLQRLINEKLLVSDREGTVATVEVAHEALFTSWPRLRAWIEGAKQVIFVRNRLSDDAGRWQKRQHKDSAGADEELLGGSRLAQAVEMRSRGDFDAILGGLGETETQFLDASAALRAKRKQEEREQQRRELEQEKQLREAEAARAKEADARLRDAETAAGRLRRRSLLIALVAICAVALAALSFWFKRRADVERQSAMESARLATAREHLATARELVFQGEKFLPRDPGLSLKLAFGAVTEARASGGAVPPEAIHLLRRVLLANPLRLEGPGAQAVAWSPDGRRLITGGKDNLVTVWDAATLKPVKKLEGHMDWIEDVAWSPDGRLLAAASRDGTARLWDASSYQLVDTMSYGDSTVQTVSFHPRRPWLAVAHTAGSGDTPMRVHIWDFKARREVFHVPGFRASWSPDGTKLVAGDGLKVDMTRGDWGSVQVFDMEGNLLKTMLGHERYVHSLAWSPDSARLATASVDDTVRVWDVAQGTPVRVLPNGFALCAAWSPDGRYLASGGGARGVSLWDAATLAELDSISSVLTLTGERIPDSGASDYIIGIAWNPEATLLAVADRGGVFGVDHRVTARIYPTRLFTARTDEDLLAVARQQLPHPPSVDEMRLAVEKASVAPARTDDREPAP